MDVLYELFDRLADWYIIAYCLLFVSAICKYKEVNSTFVVIGLLFCLECISVFIQEPLLEIGSWEAWYGTWIFLNALMVVGLYEIHGLLKINLSTIANTVALSQIAQACVQTYRYIERSFFGAEYLDTWYYVAVNSINFSIILVVLFTLIKEKGEKRVGLYI
jgi:hypothetical protein